MWAIGIMFYAMIYCCLPFSASGKQELIDMIIKEEVIYPVTHAMTSEGLRILQGMLHKDPSRRIRLRKLI